ncbi:TetR family transcriptional regulator [Streptomyces sp. NPDC003077]|uniref:TetR/AcrR family transcriptional regulator n=1 Tax=Streptomyces sp. NPDC003077 TaxID=3154443 RepID=UPI0033B3B603
MARRYDPDRRQRIIDAAIKVVAEHGIAGLSHRLVAAEADVPLGSTTYHFTSLDDLLVAALRQVNESWLADVVRSAETLDHGVPLVEMLTGLVERLLAGDRTRVTMEYELYLTALRREAVRPIAAEYLDESVRILADRTGDEATARALVAYLDGLMLQYLLMGRPFDAEETRAGLERVLGAGAQRNGRADRAPRPGRTTPQEPGAGPVRRDRG